MMDRSNTSHEYTDPATDDVFYVSKSIYERTGTYFSLNTNYTKTFGSSDHKLVAMANFSRSDEGSVDSQDDYLTDADYVIDDVIPESTRGREPGIENEYRFQVDYTRPVGTSGKLEAGYQARIDDEYQDFIFEAYDPFSQEWVEDPLYSSSLNFFRNIQGAYVTYGGEVSGFQYMLGLRGEYTYRSIDHALSGDAYVINRFDYYPTLHLARQFENDHQLMLSYSKRVDRPRSWYLDPNMSYVDPYTVRVGNPELQPEYIHSIELGYQKGWGMNFLAVEMYYRNTRNLIDRITEYNDSLDLFIYKTQNINNDHSAGAEIMANWKFWNWLTVNASFTPYYYRIVGELNGESIDRESFNWRSSLNTTFQITPTTRLQSIMSYRSKSVTAQGTEKGYYYLNMALRQDFFKRKLSATLQIRDILGTVRSDFTNNGDGFTQHVVREREPRVLMLTLSYRINNYQFDSNNRRGGSDGGGMDFDGGF
jgi:outer membrane receptor protein involved in Fe transport